MKAVILAGGFGTRLGEETDIRPKPMVEIGGRPLLWHIMKHYACYGVREFVVALGYKGEYIKQYFRDYHMMSARMTIELRTGETQSESASAEDWRVHLVDTGVQSQTGGRLRRLVDLLRDETFFLTYGDGVSNVDLGAVLALHKSANKTATITAVRPPARFGGIGFDGDLVDAFHEKPQTGEGWINGGFMVFEPAVFDCLTSDESVLEIHALEHLARARQLVGYRHAGFWQCMDTLREKRMLEAMWSSRQAPWKLWHE